MTSFDRAKRLIRAEVKRISYVITIFMSRLKCWDFMSRSCATKLPFIELNSCPLSSFFIWGCMVISTTRLQSHYFPIHIKIPISPTIKVHENQFSLKMKMLRKNRMRKFSIFNLRIIFWASQPRKCGWIIIQFSPLFTNSYFTRESSSTSHRKIILQLVVYIKD